MYKLQLLVKVILVGGWIRSTFFLLNYPNDIVFVLGVVSAVGLIIVTALFIKQFLAKLLK